MEKATLKILNGAANATLKMMERLYRNSKNQERLSVVGPAVAEGVICGLLTHIKLQLPDANMDEIAEAIVADVHKWAPKVASGHVKGRP